MAIQYVDFYADAVNTVAGTFNITASNLNLQITIDGGSAQNFVLTTGGTRTAANIVSDLSALTGATASVVTVNGVDFVRIRTTTNNGASSTILFGAPSNNANATLGFTATTYHGGANVNTTFVSSSKQNVIDGIQTALTSAGWITISGGGTTNLLMQSSMSPASQNLRTRVRVKDNGNTCAVVSIENVSGSKAGSNSSVLGGQLLPGTTKTWRVIANKYQAFVFVPSGANAREYVGFGVPYIPTFLQGTIYEAAWMQGNAASDSDTAIRGSFRSGLNSWWNTNGSGNYQCLVNNSIFDSGNDGNSYAGTLGLQAMGSSNNQTTTSQYYRWHDGSAFIYDAVLMWGTPTRSDEAKGRGQLWDCFISSESYTVDTTVASFDSHNWWNLTNNNNGSGTQPRGSVFIVVP